MTTYQIHAPHFCAGIIVSGDTVLQAAPILHWTVGRSFERTRSYFEQKGWRIVPVPTAAHPTWFEIDGAVYELRWKGSKINTIILHEDGDEQELTFDELPSQLRDLL